MGSPNCTFECSLHKWKELLHPLLLRPLTLLEAQKVVYIVTLLDAWARHVKPWVKARENSHIQAYLSFI
jgi:hypothetical protein